MGASRRLRNIASALRATPQDTAAPQGTASAGETVPLLDVVVVGGGFLGLTTLAQLRHDGYRAALVTEALVGEGQSLHSHGWFHAGYLPPDAKSAKMWQEQSFQSEAMLARLGADFLRPGRAFRAVEAGAVADAMVKQAAEVGVPLVLIDPADVPGCTGGPLTKKTTTVFEMREWLFAKEKLAALLAEQHAEHIYTGSAVAGFELAGDKVEAVVLSTGRKLRTRAVTVAAGTGTRGVVDHLGPQVAEDWKRKFQSGTITMVCLKASADLLPDIATMVSIPEAPIQTAAKASADGSTVTWYITPKRPEDGKLLSQLSQPGPAEAEDEVASVRNAVRDFRTLFPAVAAAVESDSATQWGCYTGYVLRVQDHPGGPYVESVPGISNCVVSSPSLIHMISGTADQAVSALRPILGPPRPAVRHNLGELPPSPSSTGKAVVEVKIGVPNEEREGFQYQSWQAFAQRFGLPL
jgi:glycine/D-amino acid oxidase-like deaminating enzyme